MSSEHFDYKQFKDVLWLALFFLTFRKWESEQKIDITDKFISRENEDNYLNIGEWG